MKFETIKKRLESLGDPDAIRGMARYGINPDNNLGISVTTLREIGREIGHDHDLALRLWETGIRDARLLASIIDEPDKVTEEQMDRWVQEFNSWDVCDTCCGSLFDKTEYACKKAEEWSTREEVFVKRAGFALIAWLAIHHKKMHDSVFEDFLKIISREAMDERNYVKKAVSWALRQIGKRNLALNEKAIREAKNIEKKDSTAARWIARDALRELTSDKVKIRLQKKE